MSKSITSIIAVAVVSMIFLAVMSAMYLQHLPTQADLTALEDVLRREHGLYLSAAAPMKLKFTAGEDENAPGGLKIDLLLRPDLAKQRAVAKLHLGRIAESVFDHPDWRVYIQYVLVTHKGRNPVTVTKARPSPPAKP